MEEEIKKINVDNFFSALPAVREVVDLGEVFEQYRTTLSLYNEFARESNLYHVAESISLKIHDFDDMMKTHKSACRYLEAMDHHKKLSKLPQ